MKQFTKAELYGKVLELQYENEQIKKQLNIINNLNNKNYGQDATLHY